MRKFKSLFPTILLVFLRVVITVNTKRNLILPREEWMNKSSTLLLMHFHHLILDKEVLCLLYQMVPIHRHSKVQHLTKEDTPTTESQISPKEGWTGKCMTLPQIIPHQSRNRLIKSNHQLTMATSFLSTNTRSMPRPKTWVRESMMRRSMVLLTRWYLLLMVKRDPQSHSFQTDR